MLRQPAADVLDVVIPSAGPVNLALQALRSVVAAAQQASVGLDRVTVVNDRPGRRHFSNMVRGLGFHVVETPGLGPGGARNRGATEGKAPWILFLDDDIEVDVLALRVAARIVVDWPGEALIGGLRPPPTAPRWLEWTYRDGVLTPASAYLPEGPVTPTRFASAFCVVRRAAFERVEGFPEFDEFGWEDTLMGLRIQADSPDPLIHRYTVLGGTHWYLPTWSEYLSRMEQAGRRLRAIAGTVSESERSQLLEAVSLGRGPRARIKFFLSGTPRIVCELARGRLARKAAAAASFSHGYREGDETG